MKTVSKLGIMVVVVVLLSLVSGEAFAKFEGAVVQKDISNQIMIATPGASETPITYDLVLNDTQDIYDPAFPTRLTVPARVSVVRLCTSNYYNAFVQGTDVWVRARFYKSGTAYFDGNGQDSVYPPTLQFSNYYGMLKACTAPINVVPGDYFEVVYTLRNDVDGTISADRRTWFSMEILE
jgi:hypothetical protein